MDKVLMVFASILILILFTIGISLGTYNNLQNLDEAVNSKMAQVENQLKRRNDLIPNYVAVVKGYAKHENSTLTEITEARSRLNNSLKSKDFEKINKSDSELSNTLSRLMMVTENYPNLKADKNFMALQDELAGTENRLSVARMDYNNSVRELNTNIRRFPTNIIASFSNIKKRDYFEVAVEEQNTPKIEF